MAEVEKSTMKAAADTADLIIFPPLARLTGQSAFSWEHFACAELRPRSGSRAETSSSPTRASGRSHTRELIRFDLCIGHVILLSSHIGLHVLSWHQLDVVTQLHELSSPKMGSGACLDPDQTRRKLLEERQQARSRKPLPQNGGSGRVNTVYLKDRFCDVQTDDPNLCHGTSPPRRSRLGPVPQGVESRPQHQSETYGSDLPFPESGHCERSRQVAFAAWKRRSLLTLVANAIG